MTMGDEGENSSGSDSEPSADNLDEEEMAKIVPAKLIKKNSEVKKKDKDEKKPPISQKRPERMSTKKPGSP